MGFQPTERWIPKTCMNCLPAKGVNNMKCANIVLIVLLCLTFAVNAHAASTTIDTTKSGWVWRSMSEYDDPSLPAGQGRVGGPGAYAAYTFSGSSLSVAMMQAPSITLDGRAHRIGKVEVTLDGASKTVASLRADSPSAGYIVFTTDGLSAGNHVLELTAVDGWMVVDHIVIHGDDTSDQPIATTFHDDFKNGDVTRWTTYGGDWFVNDGFYSSHADDGCKALVSSMAFSDFLYQADVFIGKPNGTAGDAGLIFRVQKPSVGTDSYEGYYAGIDVAQQRIVLGKASNSWTLLSAVPYHLQSMTSYHLRVYATGPQITIVVDNIPVIRFSDDTFHSGAVGIRGFHIDAGWTHVDVSHP